MKLLKKILLWIAGIAAVLYVAVCVFFYSSQEQILFVPEKLPYDFVFHFPQPFEEYHIPVGDTSKLSGLLFRTSDSGKGLVFYVHGNAGSLRTWGEIADVYMATGYDFFVFDYRGYGKSGGSITSEAQLYADVQAVYDSIKSKYAEDRIVVLGYSIGTAPAAMLAARNHPGRLILQAPYYSMTDMMEQTYSFLPRFMLKYPLRTAEFVAGSNAPVTIFHGTADEVIYYGSSVKLRQHFKHGDTLITIKGLRHNGFTKNEQYLSAIKQVLN